MSILIKNATILTQNKNREQIKGSIYIEEDRISQISNKNIDLEAEYEIDGNKKLVLPGLVNTHTHVPMTLLRGYGDDLALNEWLEKKIWPIESKLDKKSIEIGTKLGLLEMIASGTTTFQDMYFFEDIIGEICEKIGIRAFLGFAIIDKGTPEYKQDELFIECERFIRRWRTSELVNAVVAPHGTYTCGPDSLEKTLELSTRFDVLMHIHCSETREEIYDVEKRYGKRPVHQLKQYNLLNDMMSLAHCGWVTKNEIEIIKKKGAKVCHCPVSNMKIGSGGYAPIPEFIDSKVITSLGTDGAASNNSMDMFDTMKFCSLLHKNHRWDPKILPAQTVLDLATINGARCLNIDSDVGSIEEGKKADLIMIDLSKPHLTPLHDCVSQIVYACKGSDVSTSIINGKIKYDEKEFFNIDSKKILDQAKECAKDLTNG